MLVEVTIRPARPDEAAELSALAIRSKGHWGYSTAFLDTCGDELTVRPEQCDGVHLFVAEHIGNVVGFVRLDGEPPAASLQTCSLILRRSAPGWDDSFSSVPSSGHGVSPSRGS